MASAPPRMRWTTPVLGEQVEVAPDGHLADVELDREVGHPGPAGPVDRRSGCAAAARPRRRSCARLASRWRRASARSAYTPRAMPWVERVADRRRLDRPGAHRQPAQLGQPVAQRTPPGQPAEQLDPLGPAELLDDRGRAEGQRVDDAAHDHRRLGVRGPGPAAATISACMSAGLRNRGSRDVDGRAGRERRRPRSTSAPCRGRPTPRGSPLDQPGTGQVLQERGTPPSAPTSLVKFCCRATLVESRVLLLATDQQPGAARGERGALPSGRAHPDDRRSGVVAADQVHGDAAPLADRGARPARSAGTTRSATPIASSELARPLARCDVDERRRARARQLAGDRAGQVVHQQFGQQQHVAGPLELVAIVRRQLEDRVDRLSCTPVRGVEPSAPIRSTTLPPAVGPRGPGRDGRRDQFAARRRAARSRRPTCRRRSRRRGPASSATARPVSTSATRRGQSHRSVPSASRDGLVRVPVDDAAGPARPSRDRRRQRGPRSRRSRRRRRGATRRSRGRWRPTTRRARRPSTRGNPTRGTR